MSVKKKKCLHYLTKNFIKEVQFIKKLKRQQNWILLEIGNEFKNEFL